MLESVGLEEAILDGRRRRHRRLVDSMTARGVKSVDVITLLHRRGERTTAATFSGWFTGRVGIDIDTLEYVLETLGLPKDWRAGDPVPDDPLPTWSAQ